MRSLACGLGLEYVRLIRSGGFQPPCGRRSPAAGSRRYVIPACALAAAVLVAVGAAAQPPAAWVTIKGQVVLPADVPIPPQKPLALGANPPACAAANPPLDESVIVNPKTRGIKNVVVWLRPNNPNNPKAAFAANEIHPADAKRKPAQVTITQPCCEFIPHVLAARVGDTLVVNNPAPFAHNFFWNSANNGNVNPNIPPKGQFKLPNPLAAESTPIPYSCAVHPWMKGWVRVFDHPYYAVTDEDGKFEIKDAPAGNSSIVYWQENAGFLGGAKGRFGNPIAIAAGPNNTLVLQPTTFNVVK